jgi:glutamate synthase domain-containing protein 3
VLGRTGRNFAAGMSGGVAYVLDADGDFARRCNKEMVDLETLVDAAEIDLVQNLIMKHVAVTGSTHAERLLADWAGLQSRLVKVMPREYKRALAQAKAQEAIVESVAARVATVVAAQASVAQQGGARG